MVDGSSSLSYLHGHAISTPDHQLSPRQAPYAQSSSENNNLNINSYRPTIRQNNKLDSRIWDWNYLDRICGTSHLYLVIHKKTLSTLYQNTDGVHSPEGLRSYFSIMFRYTIAHNAPPSSPYSCSLDPSNRFQKIR